MHWEGGNEGSVTLKNGKFVVDEKVEDGKTAKIVMAMQNYVDFTAEDMEFDFTKINVINYGAGYENYKDYYQEERSTWGNNKKGTITLKNCTVDINPQSSKGICESGSGTTLENTTINGYVSLDYYSEKSTLTLIGTNTITKDVIIGYTPDTYTLNQKTESGNTIYYMVKKATN
jgi:hypothetical protein